MRVEQTGAARARTRGLGAEEAAEGGERLALVVFVEGDAAVLGMPAGASGTPEERAAETVQQLGSELRQTQERLTRSREQAVANNEELRAANEELQSINEEYRSTAEELETSKEELQSINEERETVNAELKLKFEEVSRAQRPREAHGSHRDRHALPRPRAPDRALHAADRGAVQRHGGRPRPPDHRLHASPGLRRAPGRRVG